MDKVVQHLISQSAIHSISADNTDRVETLESKMRLRFPCSYRQFLAHYEFDAFTWGGIDFFGNTGSGDFDLSQRLFSDPALSPFLLQQRFIQIGQPDTGHYDPVCFDLNQRRGGEAPLVLLDHEAILSRNSLRISRQIAASFPLFIEACCGMTTR